MWKQLQDIGIYALITTNMMNRRFPLSLEEVLIGTSILVLLAQFIFALSEDQPSWKKRLEMTVTVIVMGIGLYAVPRL
jgi:hypothetical protein